MMAHFLNPENSEFLVRDIVAYNATRIFHAPMTWRDENGSSWARLPDSTPEYAATVTGFLTQYLARLRLRSSIIRYITSFMRRSVGSPRRGDGVFLGVAAYCFASMSVALALRVGNHSMREGAFPSTGKTGRPSPPEWGRNRVEELASHLSPDAPRSARNADRRVAEWESDQERHGACRGWLVPGPIPTCFSSFPLYMSTSFFLYYRRHAFHL